MPQPPLTVIAITTAKPGKRAHMEGAAMQRFQASGVGGCFADFALHRLTKAAG